MRFLTCSYLARRLLFLWVGCVLVGLSGCVKSAYPLSSPDKAKADPRLVGVWRGQKDDTGGDDGPDARVSFDAEGMGLVQAQARRGQKLSAKDAKSRFNFFVTQTPKACYLNIALPPESKESKAPDADPKARYAFARYEVVGREELRVWPLQKTQAFAAAIQAGALHGRVKKPGDPGQTVYLEDASEALLAFTEGQPVEAVFEKPTVYRRVQ